LQPELLERVESGRETLAGQRRDRNRACGR
jgi:hypothetical protein